MVECQTDEDRCQRDRKDVAKGLISIFRDLKKDEIKIELKRMVIDRQCRERS